MSFYHLVNHERRFIAMFSPKGACTTLKWWFAASLDEEIAREQQLHKYLIGPKRIEDFPGFKKVLFLRNPADRLVSFYCNFVVFYHEQWGYADEERAVNLKGKTFSEFVHVMEDLWSRGKRFQHHLVPQVDGIDGIVPDRSIRVDDLDSELVGLSRELGFEYAPERLNASPYTASITEIVADRDPEWLSSHGLPLPGFFYNSELSEIVNRIYSEDMRRYDAIGPA